MEGLFGSDNDGFLLKIRNKETGENMDLLYRNEKEAECHPTRVTPGTNQQATLFSTFQWINGKKDSSRLTVIPRLDACRRAHLMAASLASAPLLQKNTFSASEFAHNQSARAACSGIK